MLPAHAATQPHVGPGGPQRMAPHGQPMIVQPAYKGTLAPGTKVRVGGVSVVVERYLSEGGFAHVYLVRSSFPIPIPTVIGRPASTTQHVLKRMAVPDKESLAIVRNEVEVMKLLRNQPYIVHFIEASATALTGSQGYEVFILMEYCTGGGIIDFMNSRLRDRLREHEVLKIFGDVCEGLAVMHHLSPPMMHRDLKVENILLSPPSTAIGTTQPTYKLCDFGSSAPVLSRKPPSSIAECQKIEQDLNRHTTLQYRAPEMVDVYQRRVIDEKADIWALGVLLYKLCYYTTPFEENGGGPLAILNVQYRIPPQPVYSQGLKELIATLLRDQSSQRPTVDEVLMMVHRLRGTKPSSALLQRLNASQPSISKPLSDPSARPQRRPDDTANLISFAPSAVDQQRAVDEAVKKANESIVPMRRGRPARAKAEDGPAKTTGAKASINVTGEDVASDDKAWTGMGKTAINGAASSTTPGATAGFDGFGDSFAPLPVPTGDRSRLATPAATGSGKTSPSVPPVAYSPALPGFSPTPSGMIGMGPTTTSASASALTANVSERTPGDDSAGTRFPSIEELDASFAGPGDGTVSNKRPSPSLPISTDAAASPPVPATEVKPASITSSVSATAKRFGGGLPTSRIGAFSPPTPASASDDLPKPPLSVRGKPGPSATVSSGFGDDFSTFLQPWEASEKRPPSPGLTSKADTGASGQVNAMTMAGRFGGVVPGAVAGKESSSLASERASQRWAPRSGDDDAANKLRNRRTLHIPSDAAKTIAASFQVGKDVVGRPGPATLGIASKGTSPGQDWLTGDVTPTPPPSSMSDAASKASRPELKSVFSNESTNSIPSRPSFPSTSSTSSVAAPADEVGTNVRPTDVKAKSEWRKEVEPTSSTASASYKAEYRPPLPARRRSTQDLTANRGHVDGGLSGLSRTMVDGRRGQNRPKYKLPVISPDTSDAGSSGDDDGPEDAMGVRTRRGSRRLSSLHDGRPGGSGDTKRDKFDTSSSSPTKADSKRVSPVGPPTAQLIDFGSRSDSLSTPARSSDRVKVESTAKTGNLLDLDDDDAPAAAPSKSPEPLLDEDSSTKPKPPTKPVSLRLSDRPLAASATLASPALTSPGQQLLSSRGTDTTQGDGPPPVSPVPRRRKDSISEIVSRYESMSVSSTGSASLPRDDRASVSKSSPSAPKHAASGALDRISAARPSLERSASETVAAEREPDTGDFKRRFPEVDRLDDDGVLERAQRSVGRKKDQEPITAQDAARTTIPTVTTAIASPPSSSAPAPLRALSPPSERSQASEKEGVARSPSPPPPKPRSLSKRSSIVHNRQQFLNSIHQSDWAATFGGDVKSSYGGAEESLSAAAPPAPGNKPASIARKPSLTSRSRTEDSTTPSPLPSTSASASSPPTPRNKPSTSGTNLKPWEREEEERRAAGGKVEDHSGMPEDERFKGVGSLINRWQAAK